VKIVYEFFGRNFIVMPGVSDNLIHVVHGPMLKADVIEKSIAQYWSHARSSSKKHHGFALPFTAEIKPNSQF
jgi:hypothetical protein